MFAGNWTNTSPKSGSRKRRFRNSPSGSRWKWIICPATKIGSANWPRGIRGIISSAACITSPIRGTLTIPAKLSEWKNRDAFEVWRFISSGSRRRRNQNCLKSSATRICRKNSASARRRIARRFTKNFWHAAAEAGCAIELNTAGLRKDCREIYPSREILELAFQKNVPITFGSDAHAPDEVGMNFAEAVAARARGRLHGNLPVRRSANANSSRSDLT